MMSRMETLFYRDYLNIPTGMIASYPDPMSRLFNLVFIPGVAWILFLIFMTKPFKSKGIKALLMIGVTAFGIVNGLYAPWVSISQAWFIVIILVSGFYFTMSIFITKSTAHNLLSHMSAASNTAALKKYSNLLAKHDQLVLDADHYANQMNAINTQIQVIDNDLALKMAEQRRYRIGTPQYNMIQADINRLRNERTRLINDRNNLDRRRTDALRQASKYEHEAMKLKSLHGS